MNFDGKVVWITGASSGIGASLAEGLSRKGAQLILSARREEELLKVRQRCTNPDKHRVVALDLADEGAVIDAFSRVIADNSNIDVLINNGGISQRSLALETSNEVVRKILEVNFFGTVALTRLVANNMVAAGSGMIVSVSSIAGKISSSRRSSYCASKYALTGYMDALRAELHQKGVKVCVVFPGFVQTNISVNAMTGEGGNFGKVEDAIANGMPLDEFARQFIKSMEKERSETRIVRGLASLGYWIHRLSPNIYHFMLRYIKAP